MIGRVILFAACLGTVSAFFFSKKWNGLSVTFGLNPFNPNVLDDLPRKEKTAQDEGWTKIADCDYNSPFRGIRYIKDNDPAVMLLFDVQGYIAGIQCGISKSSLPEDPVYPPLNQRGNIFQEDGDRYTLTAYFTHPEGLCSSGRSASEFSEDGTGTALYIQNGTNPLHDHVRVPTREHHLTYTPWTRGHCFYGMGVHYWYNLREDMSCDDFLPVFILYNSGRLNAFGWALGVDRKSKRFEHPRHKLISWFMNPVPRCLHDYPKLSTMHIYMTAHPFLNWC